ncbi:SunI/YnzG family protein [Falsibacillus albus]|uniref:Sublancin immunity protein SunI-like PH domain-containing protein n=1 Tax=Falsibacillus albus TaxID=2478915 RepID=A0A3L7JV23_9BACI|nr:hypothetical protein [Falsibacillus albus]RLQ94643.1 hypothetical protein D9X91_14010 [Falsibacillus albus]
MEVKVSRNGQHLQMKWQLSKIDIPLSEIKEVQNDDTYGGEDKEAIRIGFPYGTTNRVVIKTRSETYIIFTSKSNLKEKILSFMN